MLLASTSERPPGRPLLSIGTNKRILCTPVGLSCKHTQTSSPPRCSQPARDGQCRADPTWGQKKESGHFAHISKIELGQSCPKADSHQVLATQAGHEYKNLPTSLSTEMFRSSRAGQKRRKPRCRPVQSSPVQSSPVQSTNSFLSLLILLFLTSPSQVKTIPLLGNNSYYNFFRFQSSRTCSRIQSIIAPKHYNH